MTTPHRPERRFWLEKSAASACLAGAGGWLGLPAPARSATSSAVLERVPACLHPEYVVTAQGQRAGQARISVEGGQLRVDFSYRDNGRGPDVKERISLDAAGRPVGYASEGTATFGAAIAERFTFDSDGRVRWRSRVDEGDQPAQADELFMPLEPSPAYFGLVASWLRARRGAAARVSDVPDAPDASSPRAPLTLGGPGLRLTVAQRLSIPDPPGGSPLELELVALEGLDSTPMWGWMEAGAAPRFFGFVGNSMSTLPPGRAQLADQLLLVQARAKDEQLSRLHAEVTLSLPGLTVIERVRWFDAPAARLRGPSDVWVLDGRIRAVTEPGAWKVTPERRIPGEGRTLLPGLFDMHGHVHRGELLNHLAFGVTTVRDMGNENTDFMRLRAAVEQGRLSGPNLVPLGFIEGHSPFAASGGITARSLPEAIEAADWYHARGVRQLKLYNSIKPEWVAPVVRHAKSRGMKVGGHVPAFMRAEEVVRAGFDEISHINQVMLNFVVREGDDTRTLQRFTRVGDDAHGVALDNPRAQAFLKLLGSRRTVVDPTLVAFEAMYTQQQGEFNPSLADMREHLPAAWQRILKVAELDLAGPVLQTYRGSWRQLLALTGALYRAGAVVVPGTDGPSGTGLHRELALLVQAGLTPAQALQAATSVSAAVCGVQQDTGRIAPGLRADLVLVDGNPLERITDLRRISLVVCGPRAYEPATVLQRLGFKPFVPGALSVA